jgi:hypothetical protein
MSAATCPRVVSSQRPPASSLSRVTCVSGFQGAASPCASGHRLGMLESNQRRRLQRPPVDHRIPSAPRENRTLAEWLRATCSTFELPARVGCVGRPGIEPGPRSLKGYRSALELTSLAFFWTGAFHRVRPFRIVSWGAWDSNPASAEATDLQSALGATPTPQIKKRPPRVSGAASRYVAVREAALTWRDPDCSGRGARS